MWAPQPAQLHRVREHIANTYPEIQRIAHAAPFKRAVGPLEGEPLTRPPRGFAKDDPAVDFLKHRRFVAGREFPANFATSRAFYPTVLRTFKAILPLVRFLNEPLIGD
jgi:uncharacterized protein (DUF2461 family)